MCLNASSKTTAKFKADMGASRRKTFVAYKIVTASCKTTIGYGKYDKSGTYLSKPQLTKYNRRRPRGIHVYVEPPQLYRSAQFVLKVLCHVDDLVSIETPIHQDDYRRQAVLRKVVVRKRDFDELRSNIESLKKSVAN